MKVDDYHSSSIQTPTFTMQSSCIMWFPYYSLSISTLLLDSSFVEKVITSATGTSMDSVIDMGGIGSKLSPNE